MSLNFDRIRERLRARLAPRVETAAECVQAHAHFLVDEPYPPASAPGDPPHKRTGELQDGIEVIMGESANEIFGSIGTSVGHGRDLEFGTKKMQSRPWLLRSLKETKSKVKQILGGR